MSTPIHQKQAAFRGCLLKTAFEPMRHFPHAAPARDRLAPGLRVTFHGAYAIYYQPRPDEIIIIRVLHGARDIAAIAEHGGFRAEGRSLDR